jgi:hypothetical protein
MNRKRFIILFLLIIILYLQLIYIYISGILASETFEYQKDRELVTYFTEENNKLQIEIYTDESLMHIASEARKSGFVRATFFYILN